MSTRELPHLNLNSQCRNGIGIGTEGGNSMPFTSEEDWRTAITEAKEELAAAYATGKIDIPQPVDLNLTRLATAVAGRVIRSAN